MDTDVNEELVSFCGLKSEIVVPACYSLLILTPLSKRCILAPNITCILVL